MNNITIKLWNYYYILLSKTCDEYNLVLIYVKTKIHFNTRILLVSKHINFLPYGHFVTEQVSTYYIFHSGKTYVLRQYGIYRIQHSGTDFYHHRQINCIPNKCTTKE